MNRSRPAPIFPLFRGETDKLKVMLVEEVGGAVWTCRPCQSRDSVDDQIKLVFARPQSLVSLLDFLQSFLECRACLHPFGDVHIGPDKFYEVARLVQDRMPGGMDVLDCSIGENNSVVRGIICFLDFGSFEEFPHALLVFRMTSAKPQCKVRLILIRFDAV